MVLSVQQHASTLPKWILLEVLQAADECVQQNEWGFVGKVILIKADRL